jgi:hypothetical protein
MEDRRIYLIYLRRMLAAAACLFLIPVATSESMKVWFGELEPSQVVARQLENRDILYLSGLSQDVASYKLELAKAEHPEVIAIGSSRALQVRDFFFSKSFVNWGLAVRSVGQLEWATRAIVTLQPRPKLVIIFLDAWWFNERHQSAKDVYVLRQAHLSNIYRNTYVLIKNLFVGKLSNRDKRLGLGAIRSNQGFDYYGSFHYVAEVTGRAEPDVRFENTLRRIQTQDDRWIGGDEANHLAIERWRTATTELENNGVQVITILPPFSSVVVDKMRLSGNYGYLWRLAEQLGGSVLDYTDPRRLPAFSDCEFIDGSHGGEVLYARLLFDVAQQRPELALFLDTTRLGAWIDTNRGLAAPTTIRLHSGKAREIDFLRLGCAKERN